MTLLSSVTRPAQAAYRAVHERSDGLCRIDDEDFYRITSYDRLPYFLMSIVSDTDLWMFVSSSGGLTAGRKNEDSALFPYETDDRLHKMCRTTGPFTLLRAEAEGETPVLWEPFAQHISAAPVQRNLYKSVLGNQVMFEEVHRRLGLRFRYRWRSSDEFGFIRTCTIDSDRTSRMNIRVLDGLLNLLPAGAELVTQQRASCLINAYTQCEVDGASGIGIFAMTAMIVDKTEAADSLKANVVWSRGLKDARVLLTTDQLGEFAKGKEVACERLLKGRRGSYLLAGEVEIAPGGGHRWDIVADAGRDQFAIEQLRLTTENPDDSITDLEESISRGHDALRRNLASADGIQLTGDRMASQHHLANVLFNNMRGGVVADNGAISRDDLHAFIRQRNHRVGISSEKFIAEQPEKQSIHSWIAAAEKLGEPDLLRLCYEYLPITFSRRHGDPSRPWNRFSISVKDNDGKAILDYQGNWRDIFQNWEAMCTSFPDFIESVIAKFVNATTIDGFNPYRITREGIDWETPDPNDPWAHIGYWGDHQIVYLMRLLELSGKYHANRLAALLDSRIFGYANVPYRIKPYADLLRDRWNTIDFDRPLDQRIKQNVKQVGGDGKMLTDGTGRILHVNLLEKLLVPMLAKLSNLVVDGGIWMNTQRPEWNDANNALVGNGISMVTLCYLRRYTALLTDLLAERNLVDSELSTEVADWLRQISAVLLEHQSSLDQPQISDALRKDILDQLGNAFCEYRKAVYSSGLTGETRVTRAEIDALLTSARKYLDHAIRANQREDGLFHSYNLVRFDIRNNSLGVDHLPEMLEGQVAALSSGTLDATQTARTLQAMFDSSLFRADQKSFMLYPDRKLPGFLDRNIIPAQSVTANPLLGELLHSGNRSIIAKDVSGNYRFAGSPRNSTMIAASLDRLAEQPRWSSSVQAHRQSVLDLYESVVHHSRFTGRSGIMFGYEGLGCIYWHMVSKLLLAVQECYFNARDDRASSPATRSLADLYYRVRQGLSFNKSAEEYGAFPLDPYSHTPAHCGAQQPGMTGQVKEEILTRSGELGISVRSGIVSFVPMLLRPIEFLTAPLVWSCVDSKGNKRHLSLPPKSLGFTICQTPVIMTLGDEPEINVQYSDGKIETIAGSSLSAAVSHSVLTRDGAIDRIRVTIAQSSLLCTQQ